MGIVGEIAGTFEGEGTGAGSGLGDLAVVRDIGSRSVVGLIS